MSEVFQVFEKSFTRSRNEADRQELIKEFPELQGVDEKHFLSLRKYLRDCPQRFYSRNIFDAYSVWLNQQHQLNPARLIRILQDINYHLDKAFLSLSEVNSQDWHDISVTADDDYEMVRIIDAQVHPAYLQLTEAVFQVFCKPVAIVSRIERGKSHQGLKLYDVIDELSRSPLNVLQNEINRVVRNAIAHRGITFKHHEIEYRDDKGQSVTMSKSGVYGMVDRCLDVCNAIAAAISVFYYVNRSRLNVNFLQLSFDELKSETLLPWWRLEGYLESKVGNNNQLVLFARTNTRDFSKAQFSIFQTGLLAEKLISGFDLYFVAIHSKVAWPGFTAFDGNRLKYLRERPESKFTDYHGTVRDNLVFYVPRPALPRFLAKVDTFIQVLKFNIPEIRNVFQKQLGRPKYQCRDAKIHRKSWGCVMDANLVIESLSAKELVQAITKNRRAIVNHCMRLARKTNHISTSHFLPIGFAMIRIFKRDYRIRTLSNFGLKEDLVCTVRLQYVKRIKYPDLFGSYVDAKGPWRIAWNKAWVESNKESLKEYIDVPSEDKL